MDEIMSTRPIETITAEIQQLKADAGNAIIAIGERLIEAKEQLPHGDWLPWLTEQVDFSERTARNFMRLAREWTNRQALADLGASKALTPPAMRDGSCRRRADGDRRCEMPDRSQNEVMQAVRPEWCEKIIRGEKSIEARKSYPHQEVPFRVYIYCTVGGKTLYRSSHDGAIRLYHREAPSAFRHHQMLNGKVIGEYVCDKLVWIVSHPSVFAGHALFHEKAIKDACLTIDEAERYSGGKDVYGWNISQLKIYNNPRELSEFYTGGAAGMTHPPQSWCYVVS